MPVAYNMSNSKLSSDIKPKIDSINIDCNIMDVECHENEDDEHESCPSYQEIQALLYIGLK